MSTFVPPITLQMGTRPISVAYIQLSDIRFTIADYMLLFDIRLTPTINMQLSGIRPTSIDYI